MVQKILDELVGSGTCKVQEYGKSKIYYANQVCVPKESLLLYALRQ